MPGQIRRGGASTPLLLSMHKSRESKTYLSMHKSMVYVQNLLWKNISLYTFKILIFTKLSRFHKLQILQRLWLPLLKYPTGWTFFLMLRNLLVCLIRMPPFAQLALKCSFFILFCISFLPSSNSKIIYWLNQ